jgi:hypothetical protein
MLRIRSLVPMVVVTCMFCIALAGCSGDSGQEAGRYSSSEHEFSMVFPPGWTVAEGDGDIEPHVEATSPWEDDDDEFSEHIAVDVEPVVPGMTAETYFEKTIDAQSADIPGFNTTASGRTVIDGRDAFWIEFDLEEESGNLTVLGYAMVKGSRGYLVSCVAQARKYVSYEDVFRQAVQTFKFE